jgi:hypothetical protein
MGDESPGGGLEASKGLASVSLILAMVYEREWLTRDLSDGEFYVVDPQNVHRLDTSSSAALVKSLGVVDSTLDSIGVIERHPDMIFVKAYTLLQDKTLRWYASYDFASVEEATDSVRKLLLRLAQEKKP